MSASRIIRTELQALPAHPVLSTAGFIKLDAMESPYPFPASLREGLNARLASVSLNRYPDVHATELKLAVRQAMKIPDELDIILGNGSDEIIQLITLACAKPGATLLSLEPSFVMFKMIAIFCGLKYVGVQLTPDFEVDLEATLGTIEQHQPSVIFISYPNNPTGNLFNREFIRKIIKISNGLVVFDEAYFAFSRDSFLAEVSEFPNVVLMRTLSKLGLAGLRLGILIGRGEWLREIDKLRLPYNSNSLTQAAACFAFQHYDVLLKQAAEIVAERENLIEEILQIPDISVYPSAANFVLVRVMDSEKIFDALLSRKILVKHTGALHPLLANTLRVTVGTPSENGTLIAALRIVSQ